MEKQRDFRGVISLFIIVHQNFPSDESAYLGLHLSSFLHTKQSLMSAKKNKKKNKKKHHFYCVKNLRILNISKWYSEEENAHFRVESAWASLPYGGLHTLYQQNSYKMQQDLFDQIFDSATLHNRSNLVQTIMLISTVS